MATRRFGCAVAGSLDDPLLSSSAAGAGTTPASSKPGGAGRPVRASEGASNRCAGDSVRRRVQEAAGALGGPLEPGGLRHRLRRRSRLGGLAT
eukprot:12220510-Alexandrium_andersonii.AAC.1